MSTNPEGSLLRTICLTYRDALALAVAAEGWLAERDTPDASGREKMPDVAVAVDDVRRQLREADQQHTPRGEPAAHL
jgi:hypothetical protein